MAEPQPSKLAMPVRSRSPAPHRTRRSAGMRRLAASDRRTFACLTVPEVVAAQHLVGPGVWGPSTPPRPLGRDRAGRLAVLRPAGCPARPTQLHRPLDPSLRRGRPSSGQVPRPAPSLGNTGRHHRSDHARALTPEQAADTLGLGRSRVYELMRDRQIRSIKIGRSRRIPYANLVAFVADLEQLADTEPT